MRRETFRRASWPAGEGEMARLIREHDWADTPLGPSKTWPQSLKTAVEMVLAMPGPATILWGPEHVQLYNDAYIAVARDRHPGLLGLPAEEGWPDAYEGVIAPLLDAVRTGRPTELADYPVALHAPEGRLEERVFDTAFSPVRDESGGVAGALQTLVEVTERKRREANQELLADISEDLSRLSDEEEIVRTVGAKLAAHMKLTCYHYVDVDEERAEVTMRHFWHALDVPYILGTYPIGGFVPPNGLDILRSGQSVVVNDVQNDLPDDGAATAALKAGAAAQKIGAFVAVPYSQDGRWKAYFAAADSSPRRWTSLEIELIQEVSGWVFPRIERVRAEEALRESEEELRTFVSATSDTVYEMSADWRVMSSLESKGFIAATDNPREDWTQEYIPEDEKERVWAAIDRAVQTRSTFELEHRVNRPDGTTGWTFSRAIPLFDERGKIVKWFGAASDVTDRNRAEEDLRASEEKYRTLVENVTDHAVFMLDPEGLVTEWTESARRVTGYEAEEVVGRHFSAFYAPEDAEAGEPDGELAEAARESRAERDGWRVKKDGTRIWVNEIATAVRDAESKLVGFAKIGRDLTERRELEEERERARTRELTSHAEAAERERISRELHDRVAHHMGVAHQSLELFAALRDAAPERAAEKLALARQTTRLALDQTRALSAELKRFQEEELEDGLEAAFVKLSETYVPDGMGMEVSFSGEESKISGPVGTQAYLAMREALRNAVKHSGCSRIGVTLTALDGEFSGLVEDDGEGFDVEAVARATPSWGVGLRSMRERAEMLGGTLRLDSQPGKGTRVEIMVPLDGHRP